MKSIFPPINRNDNKYSSHSEPAQLLLMNNDNVGLNRSDEDDNNSNLLIHENEIVKSKIGKKKKRM